MFLIVCVLLFSFNIRPFSHLISLLQLRLHTFHGYKIFPSTIDIIYNCLRIIALAMALNISRDFVT